jgi:site-specific DNA recombinase
MDTSKKTKAVVYARVSSKEQEETGYSLDAQEELLKSYADKPQHQFDVIKKFRISESASGKTQRATFAEMMRYMDKNKINVLICEKVDRLTRNFKDAIVIDEWLDKDETRQVHLVKDSLILHKNSKSQEKLNWGIRILFAKNYTDNLSEEVKKGQKQKTKEGWLPTKPPLGYKTVGEKGRKLHLIDDKVAPYIKEMFTLYATNNYSTLALSEKMYKSGFRSRNGGKVVKSQIHRLLCDPFYYGKFVWKDEVYQGKHEPIITKDLFEEVHSKLSRGGAPYQSKHDKELQGKVFCGNCQKTITWELQKGHWYGACKQCKAQLGTEKKYVRQEYVEDELIERIASVAPQNERVMAVLHKALKESHLEESTYHDTQVESINNKLERIQQRIKTMYDDRLDGRISVEAYDQKLVAFSQEKEDLIEALSKLNSDNTQYYKVGIAIHELALRSRAIYASTKASVEERRLLLGYAFSNVTVLRGEVKPEYTKAYGLLAEWMPRVNETLELEKDGSNKGKESTFVPSHPILLRG